MKNIAIVIDNVVDNIVSLSENLDVDDFLASIGLEGVEYLDNSTLNLSVGQARDVETSRWIPNNFRPGFIFDKEIWKWVPPHPVPEDATWIPELFDEPSGHQDLQEKRVYFWIDSLSCWGMLPNCERPSNDHAWHPLEKEWQIPTSPRPGDNYAWNSIDNKWILMQSS